MSESKHTPGPWKLGRMVDGDGVPMRGEALKAYLCDAVDNGVLEDFYFVSQGDRMPDICHTGNGPTSIANGRLISAAPDLLDALINLRNEYLRINGCYPLPFNKGYSEMQAVDAAIAKAKGETVE